MPKKWNDLELMDLKVMYNVPIRMRDGVTLYMDVYRPDNDEKYPAILNRTPYLKDGHDLIDNYMKALVIAGCGYNVVFQDVRGTGHSEGVCDPAGHQDEDGFDTVEAIAAMPWCDGNVGTSGESYNGFSQLSVARANPPHLKTVCPFMTSWTKFPGIYDWGIFSPVMFSWAIGRVLDKEKYDPGHYSPEIIEKMKYFSARTVELVDHLPMVEMPAANIPELPELYCHRELLENLDNKEYLADIGRVEGFEQTTVPTLNLTGWNDFLRDKTIYNYTQFVKRGGSEDCRKKSRLIVGPWKHSGRLEGNIEGVDYGPEGSNDGYGFTRKLIDWYNYHLKGQDSKFMQGAPIRLFVMGKNQWRDEYEWPLARTQFTTYYLHSNGSANTLYGDGMLTLSKPGEETPDHYSYDPLNPCPSSTGEPLRSLMQDQRILQKRDDVLVYTMPAVEKETEITGPIYAELYASSSALDTDFVARVSIVHRDGYNWKLGAKLVRARYRNGEKAEALVPGQIYKFRIEAANTSIVLQPGETIRLDVTSALYPDADRNMNTFGRIGFDSAEDAVVAHQTIYHDAEHPSALILPIIPDQE